MPSVFSYLNSSHNRSWPTVWKIVILLSMYSWCDSMILYKPSHFSSHFVHLFLNVCTYWALEWVSESYSVMSDSLRPHGLNSLWNSPGQDTGVGSFSLHQGIFPTQVSHIAGGFFASWATREAQEYWSGLSIASTGDLPDPGIKLGSPALQAGSLPAEPPGKPTILYYHTFSHHDPVITSVVTYT